MPAVRESIVSNQKRRNTESTFTLTHATHYGRLFVKFGSIALVVMIVGRMFLTAAIAYWKAMNPEPPPPPTAGFGKLPALRFPELPEENKPTSYSLELADGTFADLGDRAKVFLMPKAVPNLLADQKVKDLAMRYDFTNEPQVINTRTYRWTKSQPLEMSLQMDLQNNTFSMKSNYLSRPDLLLNNQLPEDFEAVNTVKTVLSGAEMLPVDVATASGKVSFWKALGGELREAVSLSDADFLRVDLDRNPIDQTPNAGSIPMYSPDGSRGAISALLSGATSANSGIVELEYNYFPVDYAQMETYPIRTPDQAWSILQAGEGAVINPGTQTDAVIRDVSLGYYDDWEEQEYLQPIYVFVGDSGFVGYVSAVDPRYILADPQPLE